MRFYEFNLIETATTGSTNSGCIAMISQAFGKKKPLGVGFDPNGDQGIYSKKIGSDKKPILIKRIQ